MENDFNEKVERLLEAPYWVIDLLPQQVPQDGGGQFFFFFFYYLDSPQHERLYRQFADVLLKLNCYYDLMVNHAPSDKWVKNPLPEKLSQLLTQSLRHGHLCILVDGEDALITASSGNSYLTLYNPSQGLLQLVGQLTSAAGLFLWQPPREANE